ncbi:DUF2169 domain-containing protein [Paracoccus sp. DMF]|uniref:DUF2169 family type VI secretion system accessory protein n=1 Tax=Paracoccus sp. DMF TaxID=400837 RepID=UPI0021E35A26|nr:DUF2169 domain-containing protein [Paracoccus sp. DMF]MCV2447172.1 DUF2169 domain-containing protein [Paracoccus sp. DMF]
MTFDHWDEQGREISIVIVKGTFRREDEGWTRSDRQSEIGFTDEYDGDPAYAPLIREQDIAPGKPATDIVLRAIGFAPGGKPRPSWPVGVIIPGLLDYGFEVRGPSQWQKSFLGRWKPTDPGPVDQVPIDYRLAYGGTHRLPDGSMALHEFNPAGLGFVIGDLKHFDDPVLAPQIGAVADLASRDIRARLGVHGFRPIPRTWLPRRQLAGTYDDHWLQTRHPHLPPDFNPRFWNAAPKPLQISPHLLGNEELQLHNLHPIKPTYRLNLPGLKVQGRLMPTGRSVAFVLDSVELDVRSPHEHEHMLTLTWRTSFATSDLHESLEIHIIEP